MKKLTMLGATTVAGTLLFTGLGTAHAAENGLSDSQIQDSAHNYIQSHGIKLNPGSKTLIESKDSVGGKVPDGYKSVMFGEQGHNGPSYILVNTSNGQVIDPSVKDNPTTDNQSQAQTSSEKATDNTVNTQQNEQQTQATNSNSATQNNTQEQSQAKALPETGQSNTTFVTTIAAILLAVGSLLTFRRVSKNQ